MIIKPFCLKSLIAFQIIVILLLGMCSNNSITSSNLPSSGNNIHGVLINGKNGQPIAEAKVICLPSGYIPSPKIGSQTGLAKTVTNKNGEFTLLDLEKNTYNIISEKDSLKAILYSIVLESNSDMSITDTLNPTSSIIGTVKLLDGDDPRTVLIMVVGTTIFTYPVNIQGGFCIKNIPPGKYKVRFLSTIDTYVSIEVEYTVAKGVILISPTVELPCLGSASVQDMQAEWDSLNLVSNLFWIGETTCVVRGFNVYRIDHGKQQANRPLNSMLITSNSFTDSTCNIGSRYTYFVRPVDKNGVVGPYFFALDTIEASQAYKPLNPINLGMHSFTNEMSMIYYNHKFYFIEHTGSQFKIISIDTSGSYMDYSTQYIINHPLALFVQNTKKLFVADINPADSSKIRILNISDTASNTVISQFTQSDYFEFFSYMNSYFCIDSFENIFTSNWFSLNCYKSNGTFTRIDPPFYPNPYPVKKIMLSGNNIVTIGEIEDMNEPTTSKIALINGSDLSVTKTIKIPFLIESFATDSSGNIFVLTRGITNSYIIIFSPELLQIGKIILCDANYQDIAVDQDGTIGLSPLNFIFSSNQIVRYKK